MKLKHHYFYDEMYAHHFVFILNVTSDKQLEKILKSNYPMGHSIYKAECEKDKDLLVKNIGGGTLTNDNATGSIIIVVDQEDESIFYSVLAHECLHAVMDVLNSRGVEYSPKKEAANEAFTYYLSYLMKKALK